MARPTAASKTLEIEERRENVLTLLRAGGSVRSISKALSVPKSTIGDDVKAIREFIKQRVLSEGEQWYYDNVDRLGVAIDALMPKVMKGNAASAQALSVVIRQQSTMLGHQKGPDMKISMSMSGGVDVNIEQESAIVRLRRAIRSLRAGHAGADEEGSGEA